MTGGDPEVTTGPLSDEIIDLANAHVKLDKEACRLKNEYDTLLEKNQDLADVNAKLKLQTKVPSQSSLQLQQQVATLQQQNKILQRQVENLDKQQPLTQKHELPTSQFQSAEHPDPDIFSANNAELRKDLPLFVRKINMKFIANADWYPTEQSKMLYLVSRLKGKAYSIIAYGINRNGTANFASTDAILVLLEQAFASINEQNVACLQILTIKQGRKDTATHISDWFEVARKTKLSDNALINHLYDSLHPNIKVQIQNRVMLRQPLPTDLTSYLIEVRHIDAVLRSSNPNYTTSSLSSGSHSSLPLPSTASPPPPGDPMNLSAAKISPVIVWTSSDAENHRIPRNEAEKSAKRNYCFEN
ncbi:Bgt-51754 [Blumeria graminis f. sp. tritici]|uniref:Bgt-51754 n=1 Tax=Blumeria graminis f. sp. tritici TaxID=62690 RepID=A0A9X9MQ57_BLUGR|nr:Bgt-51754 [Blumeria graminis f. sp. tritici]